MSRATKSWIAAEKRLGQQGARVSVLLGMAQMLAGAAAAFCAAHLLAAVLVPGLRRVPVEWGYGAGFAVLALMRALLMRQVELLGFERGAAARRRLRSDIFGRFLTAGPQKLRGRHSAELAAITVDRVEAMEGFHARWIQAMMLAVLGPVMLGAIALLVDWRSGLILLLAGGLVPLGMALAGIGAGKAARAQFVAMTRLQVRFLDRIRGISTLVLAGRAADEAASLGLAADELRVRTMRVLRVAFLSSSVLDLAAAAALVLVVLRFLPDLRAETAAVTTALFLLLLVPEFFAPLRAFAAVYQDRMAAEAAAVDLADVPPVPEPVPAVDIRSVAAQGIALAFEDVSFAWDAGRGPVVEHLSFRVPAGETLLLTGASGSGKSSIMDLILGFVAPDSGRVSFNGIELATVTPAARARMIGWIGQKPVIFGGTILENIRFARPEASADEVDDAVKLARLADLVAALPLGLETPIGEAGFGLSGGQVQRIAIARAFLKDAPLLLLDEPTAHLDPALERDVLESLKRLAIGRTVVLASHSALAHEFARDTSARRLDLDAVRHGRARGVA